MPETRGDRAKGAGQGPRSLLSQAVPSKRVNVRLRAVILVGQITPMGCQILTIGAAGWAPVELIFHCVPPHCLKQQKGDHQKLSLVPSVSFPVINTSWLCIPLHQHITLVTHTWRQQLEAKGYLNNKTKFRNVIQAFSSSFISLEGIWPMFS